jgi:hypothetical protein
MQTVMSVCHHVISGWFEDPSETIAETIDSNLLSGIDDLVAVPFENDPTRFLKASHIPVNGTNHSLFAFEIDAVMLDTEVRAALGASGFELSDGDDAVASHFRSPIWLYIVTWASQVILLFIAADSPASTRARMSICLEQVLAPAVLRISRGLFCLGLCPRQGFLWARLGSDPPICQPTVNRQRPNLKVFVKPSPTKSWERSVSERRRGCVPYFHRSEFLEKKKIRLASFT